MIDLSHHFHKGLGLGLGWGGVGVMDFSDKKDNPLKFFYLVN